MYKAVVPNRLTNIKISARKPAAVALAMCLTIANVWWTPVAQAQAAATAAPAAAATPAPATATAVPATTPAPPAPVSPATSADAPAGSSVLLQSMRKELNRSFSQLKNSGDAPLYFLAYRVYDTDSIDVQAEYGGVRSKSRNNRMRRLDIDLRVGSPEVDNIHKIRGGSFGPGSFNFSNFGLPLFPLDDDEASIRHALWLRTDSAFKDAQKKFRQVKANKDVKVEEEDASADFSLEKAQEEVEKNQSPLPIDQAAWEAKLRKMSAIYATYPGVQDSNIEFTAVRTRRYLVTSEGTNIQDEQFSYRVFSTAESIADDGMKIWLYDGIEARIPDDLPDDAQLEKMVRKLAESVSALRTAAKAEPYAGPAILRNRASGVFFHEIFGHRIEGHRQKDEEEGRTFAKKVGKEIMPPFITVIDDPTREKFGSKSLNGFYKFDDEGVPAQKVTLVDNGVLKGFLMGRSPIKGFSVSNGHGRCSPGHEPVARQGNLIVDSNKRVPYDQLREQLIAEVKKQGKPYGLIFDEIAGGFTMTQTFLPQTFKLLPLRVWRVYADGRPDELLRGVDLVGTPLASLERIICAGDDDDTFNGTCGAESGWVPVSATSPSLLVGTIEVELQSKAQDKPPLLPAPLFDKGDKGSSTTAPPATGDHTSKAPEGKK